MFKEIGSLFGSITVLLYLLAILNYLVKFIYKKYRNELIINEKLYSSFTKFMKFIVKRHNLFGVLTIAFLLLHFLIQFSQYGLNTTGVIAAGIMLLQVGLGIYGSKVKKRGGTWLLMHRTIAVLILIAIGVHVE